MFSLGNCVSTRLKETKGAIPTIKGANSAINVIQIHINNGENMWNNLLWFLLYDSLDD